jgi:hypothetical protein
MISGGITLAFESISDEAESASPQIRRVPATYETVLLPG